MKACDDLRDVVMVYLNMWFELTPEGSIRRSSPKPLRFALQGCADGNIALIREDMTKEARQNLLEWVEKEPPLTRVDSEPFYWHRYKEILGAEASIEEEMRVSLNYSFPRDLSLHHDVELITSESEGGRQLVTDTDVINSVAGWWELGKIRAPWCIALAGSEIASIVETVKIGRDAIECGVKTAPHLRRGGFASAAIAGWFSVARRQHRHCFYSTEIDNIASQGLARHLELQFLGPTFGLR